MWSRTETGAALLACFLAHWCLSLHCGKTGFSVAVGVPARQAAFLLPWRRVFNLSDSQLFVARRENAKALFRGFIDSRGGTLQARTPPLRFYGVGFQGRCRGPLPRLHRLARRHPAGASATS